MQTLTTGKINAQLGFTLLELMVAVVIIGLLVATIALNVGAISGKSALEKQAQSLLNALNIASEEAILFNRIYGIKFIKGGYYFSRLKYSEDKKNTASSSLETSESPDTATAQTAQQSQNYLGRAEQTAQPELKWHKLNRHRQLQQIAIDEKTTIKVIVDGMEIELEDDSFKIDDEQEKKPTLIIMPSGEIEPSFEVYFKQGQQQIKLILNQQALLELSQEDDRLSIN